MMTMLPSYVQLVALVLGVAWHRGRWRRIGRYPAWRKEFPAPA
ncbi:hypothetical protein [Novosphingobium soli]|uniref:Cellulose biosynthesis protein BcsF n=1 Tax=Novosphingobium soli TaxID=574956 RepID=A0ABV6CXQ5_9SPHN